MAVAAGLEMRLASEKTKEWARRGRKREGMLRASGDLDQMINKMATHARTMHVLMAGLGVFATCLL
jgi:hypothetical protein